MQSCNVFSMPHLSEKDLLLQVDGASHMGDRLRSLLCVLRQEEASAAQLLPPLTDLVQYILNYAGWYGGAQQDAGELLMHVLNSVDGGTMASRVCCAGGEGHVAGIRLVTPPEDAESSGLGVAVPIASLLLAALTGDQALADAPEALVLQVGQSYEHSGELFPVDAQVDWGDNVFHLTCAGVAASTCYRVAGYVRHIALPDVPVAARMRSGHYISYLHSGDMWYEADDSRIMQYSMPPTAFPYLVFLTRVDSTAHGKRKRCAEEDDEVARILSKRARVSASSHVRGLCSGAGSSTDAIAGKSCSDPSAVAAANTKKRHLPQRSNRADCNQDKGDRKRDKR